LTFGFKVTPGGEISVSGFYGGSYVNSQWSRSVDGILAGVCKSIARRCDVDVMLVRIAWIFAVLFFGIGLGAYIVLAIGLPREDKLAEAYEPRLLGVCSRFARRFHLDVGLTRVGFLTVLVCSGGLIVLGYFILHFILPKNVDLDLAKPADIPPTEGHP
jgi:phage shock protein C